MKYKNFFFTLAAIALLLSASLFARGNSSSMDGVVIVLNKKTSTHSERPRTPAYIPFHAELMELGVLLSADANWGEATVSLSSIEGDYYQTLFDMADGAILLPINGTSGDSYTIEISVEEGQEFEGTFIL